MCFRLNVWTCSCVRPCVCVAMQSPVHMRARVRKSGRVKPSDAEGRCLCGCGCGCGWGESEWGNGGATQVVVACVDSAVRGGQHGTPGWGWQWRLVHGGASEGVRREKSDLRCPRWQQMRRGGVVRGGGFKVPYTGRGPVENRRHDSTTHGRVLHLLCLTDGNITSRTQASFLLYCLSSLPPAPCSPAPNVRSGTSPPIQHGRRRTTWR